MIRPLLLSSALLGLVLSLPGAARAAELLMFESATCPFCEKWDDDLSAIYPKTAEGKRAPLRRVDNDIAWPDDLGEVRPVRYTPTFVLVENGREVGRITGYNSEDFFWGLLGQAISEMPVATE